MKSLATSDRVSGISGWELNMPTLNRAAGGSNYNAITMIGGVYPYVPQNLRLFYLIWFLFYIILFVFVLKLKWRRFLFTNLCINRSVDPKYHNSFCCLLCFTLFYWLCLLLCVFIFLFSCFTVFLGLFSCLLCLYWFFQFISRSIVFTKKITFSVLCQ